MGAELEPIPRAQVLADNTFAIVNATDLTDVEKLAAIASLVPMALQVEQEARGTIARLRDENAALRARLGDTTTT